MDPVLEEVRPEALLVLGDTNSCLAAIAAKRRKVPVFHMEAGNRCFDQRVPEEINRVIVDHISDVNMPYSSISLSLIHISITISDESHELELAYIDDVVAAFVSEVTEDREPGVHWGTVQPTHRITLSLIHI